MVVTTHCEMCMMEFDTLNRCIKHIDRSAKYCKLQYIIRNHIYPDDVVLKVDEESTAARLQLAAQGRSNICAATAPAQRSSGPLLRVAAMRP